MIKTDNNNNNNNNYTIKIIGENNCPRLAQAYQNVTLLV